MINPYIQVWLQSTKEEQRQHLYAYHRYQQRCKLLANRYQQTDLTVYALFAVLSPNNAEDTNWIAVERILEANEQKTIHQSLGIPAYGRDQYKAWGLLFGAMTPQDALTGPKVWNFYKCIRNPEDPEAVVIDGHMANIYRGTPEVRLTEVKLSKSDYETMADSACEASRRVTEASQGLVIIRPSQLQAVCWYTWKRIHNIKDPLSKFNTPDQACLFDEPNGKS